jgi:phosphoribosylformimino-5-aminoimidazole carboxamide ribotide isomerase
MMVIPAIDLRGGRCVRLVRGDPAEETVYETDPIAVARTFESDGAARLHIVDLDAALGTGSNRTVVTGVCQSVSSPVQLGGGLRTMDAIARALADGAARAILGTAAALDPGFVTKAVGRFRDRVIVAVDVRDDLVMVRGWRDVGPRLEEAIEVLTNAGAPRFLVTSVQRDGTMDGPDLALYERVAARTESPGIASGGVGTADDVQNLGELGLEAVVVGKALYSGTIRLSEVVSA